LGVQAYRRGAVDVLDLGKLPLSALRLGTATVAQGKASFDYVAKVIALALAGEIDHTDIYGDLTRTADFTMMLAEGGFRVTHSLYPRLLSVGLRPDKGPLRSD